ncbi:MAG TPA: flavodoxin domain-containing protein [Longilinea sp.]|nr:flavodoxin domain-containing protein [Longilinea sp.]
MSKILVAYSTNSGSTGEVADALAAELIQAGHIADVCLIKEVKDLSTYDGVVVGAPMILGWQNSVRQFLKQHRAELAAKKVAYFACAMRLTQVPEEVLPQVSLVLDPNLVIEPVKPSSLTIKERFTTLGYYLKPMLQAAPGVKPLSVAFFNGKLEMYRLKWWQAAFVMVVVQAVPGDYRDWDFIKAWGRTISQEL